MWWATITLKELLPVALACATWGSQLMAKQFLFLVKSCGFFLIAHKSWIVVLNIQPSL
jgi:hypothetical protein